MSIQITLTNPFARYFSSNSSGDAADPGVTLIRLLGEGPHQLIEYEKSGSLGNAPAGGLIATLATAAGPIELGIAVSAMDAVDLFCKHGQHEIQRTRLDGLAGMTPTWEHVLAQPSVVRSLASLRHAADASNSGRSRITRRGWGWPAKLSALAVVAALAVAGLIALGKSVGAGTGVGAAAMPAAASGPQDLLNADERALLSRIVAESGIALDPSVKGKPFVVFSDPNCPACRALEKSLQQMDKDQFTPIVLPVAFKDGSSDKVAGVLCSKDVALAWGRAAGTDEPAEIACEKGQKQVESNNAAFVALRLTSTPTIAAPNGRVISGSGSLEQLITWLRDNS